MGVGLIIVVGDGVGVAEDEGLLVAENVPLYAK